MCARNVNKMKEYSVVYDGLVMKGKNGYRCIQNVLKVRF